MVKRSAAVHQTFMGLCTSASLFGSWPWPKIMRTARRNQHARMLPLQKLQNAYLHCQCLGKFSNLSRRTRLQSNPSEWMNKQASSCVDVLGSIRSRTCRPKTLGNSAVTSKNTAATPCMMSGTSVRPMHLLLFCRPPQNQRFDPMGQASPLQVF